MPVTSLALPERISIENANVVMLELCQLIEANDVPINLSAVTHCDSAGVAVLIAAVAYAKQHNRPLSFQNPPKQLCELAVFLKVDDVLFTAATDSPGMPCPTEKTGQKIKTD